MSKKKDIAKEAWLFMDEKLPSVMGGVKIPIYEKISLGIVNYLMMEFAIHYHEQKKKEDEI